VEFPDANDYLPSASKSQEDHRNGADGTSLEKKATSELQRCLIELTLCGFLRDLDLLGCESRLGRVPELQPGSAVSYDSSTIFSFTAATHCFRCSADHARVDCNERAIIAPHLGVLEDIAPAPQRLNGARLRHVVSDSHLPLLRLQHPRLRATHHNGTVSTKAPRSDAQLRAGPTLLQHRRQAVGMYTVSGHDVRGPAMNGAWPRSTIRCCWSASYDV
jgi:hypothetical protein